MIHFDRVPEPPEFDNRVRKRGAIWLKEHPVGRPTDYWCEFSSQLRDGFHWLCAYTAMRTPSGEVDHFLPCDEDRTRAYEWSNYRYADGSINSRKSNRKAAKILDPFKVEDGWFEILLPSLELVTTDRCPAEVRERATFMLEILGLGRAQWIIDMREAWFAMYLAGKLTLDGLDDVAPLIARAICKREVSQNAPKEQP